jgi:hypothetical protein
MCLGLLPYFTGQGRQPQGAARRCYRARDRPQPVIPRAKAARRIRPTRAIGNNNAGAELNNYKVGANIWNGLMGGANFLAGGAGGQGRRSAGSSRMPNRSFRRLPNGRYFRADLANSAQTNADFDLGKINKSYWEGQDQYAKNQLRDAFKDGVPTNRRWSA